MTKSVREKKSVVPLALLEEAEHSTMQLCIIGQCVVLVHTHVADTFVTFQYNGHSQLIINTYL